MLLIIDTAGNRCSVMLTSTSAESLNNQAPSQLYCEGVQQHSERLLPMISELLLNSNIVLKSIAAVAFNQGPGAFTGLRVAAAVSQGFGFVHQIPIVPLPMHTAFIYEQVAVLIKKRVAEPTTIWMVSNAHMNELYVSAYTFTATEPFVASNISVALIHRKDWSLWVSRFQQASVVSSVKHILLAQTIEGWSPTQDVLSTAHYEEFTNIEITRFAMYARFAYQQQAFVPPEQALPLYIRDKVAFTTQERHAGISLPGNPTAPVLHS